ncbi:hypothetical protein B835_1965 [Enterococcus mundtii 3F]|uniref:Uncharacterized protein n=1 Tax=Enterococcus faecium TaxID=1352 RepID=A0A0D5MC98_ENTFC|nr:MULTISPECIES: hypothetical protein [Enterococcus]AJY53572.1 hypothetical protein pEfm12493_088 [Enterococcus faecium]MDA9462038.1 hypothetical protein [Enterococcus mundtii 3F]
MLAGDIYGVDGIPGANVELIADGNWHELTGEFNFDEPNELGIYKIEPLMTKVTRFLGIEHTCKRIRFLLFTKLSP